MNRREFLTYTAAIALAPVVLRCFADDNAAAATLTGASMPPATHSKIKTNADPNAPALNFLSWDTENTGRETANLLRTNAAVTVRYVLAGKTITAMGKRQKSTPDASTYEIPITDGTMLTIGFHHPGNMLEITAALSNSFPPADLSALEIHFPFATQPSAVTALPASIDADATFRAPLLLHAPDFGQLLVSANVDLAAQLTGNYAQRSVDFILQLPAPTPGQTIRVTFTPYFLPAPPGLSSAKEWPRIRRGWFSTLQAVSGPAPGDDRAADPDQISAGMLGNEVISGTASCSLWLYADHVLLLPQLAPQISAANLLRYTLDWTFAHRVRPDGTVVGYWMIKPYDKFIDSHPSLIISAWDYVEATHDHTWLTQNIATLDRLGQFLAARDIDHDGLIESIQSGNAGTLINPERGSTWFDAINSGHKDAYNNTLTYRAFLCLADLHSQLQNSTAAANYRNLAGKLKAAFTPALLNPATGWLGWWRSDDGQLHDPASPLINALATQFGLLDLPTARTAFDNLFAKLQSLHFTRFDLGVPLILSPIPKADYLIGLPGIAGTPSKDDGSDTFGQYQNGGIHAGHSLHILTALHQLGRTKLADDILHQMLTRQDKGLFQNGVWGTFGKGIEWTTWTGEPSGADGTLADNFRFLAALLLREPQYRQRLLRPLPSASL